MPKKNIYTQMCIVNNEQVFYNGCIRNGRSGKN